MNFKELFDACKEADLCVSIGIIPEEEGKEDHFMVTVIDPTTAARVRKAIKVDEMYLEDKIVETIHTGMDYVTKVRAEMIKNAENAVEADEEEDENGEGRTATED